MERQTIVEEPTGYLGTTGTNQRVICLAEADLAQSFLKEQVLDALLSLRILWLVTSRR